MSQNIFKSNYVIELIRNVKKGRNINTYSGDKFPIKKDMIIPKHDVDEPLEIKIFMPDESAKDNKDFENAISLFKAYPYLNRTQATDIRFWTYLSHTSYWDYLQKRWPLTGIEETDKKNILQHWFIDGLSAKNIARHGVASLWWGAYTTFNNNLEDSYELTKEFFSMVEYRRSIFEGTLGRYPQFMHAILEFVIDNPDLFVEVKETRIRHLMRKINLLGGYTILGRMSKDEIKKQLSAHRDEILNITVTHQKNLI